MPQDARIKGHATLESLGIGYAEGLEEALAPIAPGFAESLIAFAFGDIYTRPGLDLKMRELATIAALTALGTSPAQLKVHIGAAMNVGCSHQDIAEVIVQTALYAGIPAALNGLFVAKEQFAAQA